jgi:peptide/nickel transport system ATP-binding protein
MSVKINKLKISLGGETLVDISLTIESSLGLVGRSGSGKSLTLKAHVDMTPRSMIVEKEVDAPFVFERGKSVAFIPQNPFTALSPMSKIKDQFRDPNAEALLEQTGLGGWALQRFPAELSGGQLQRIICAIALASKPKLLLLDEPTTALDYASKADILRTFKAIADGGTKTLFVSHDFSSVAAIADTIAVIDWGKIIETGATADILSAPKREETKKLIECGFENREFRK